MSKNVNPTQLLMLSAMALPGIAESATAPTDTHVSYQFTQYTEEPIDEDKKLSGSQERYTIDVHQLQLVQPLSETKSLHVDLTSEAMTGASPWATAAIETGAQEKKAGVIMSGASISEQRNEIGLSYTAYEDNHLWRNGLGYSVENDYQSLSLSSQASFDFNQKNTALALGVSGSFDSITPTDADAFNRVASEIKYATSGFASFAQVLNRNAIIQIGGSVTQKKGFLSDPYKLADRRPEEKSEQAYTVMYRQYINTTSSAMHLDYRFYMDTWQLQSHTLQAQWHQRIGKSLKIFPSLRYYFQGEAFFYDPYEINGVQQEYFSSDYRLSPFGSISLGLGVSQQFKHWGYRFFYENYQADANYSPQDVLIENPGLVAFKRFSLQLNVRW